MDLKRITTALLGFPVVVAILLIGNIYIVDIALAIVAMLAIDEYFNAITKVSKPVRWLRICKLYYNSIYSHNI